MEREDIALYQKIRDVLEDYGIDYLLEINDMTPEDVVYNLVKKEGLKLPYE